MREENVEMREMRALRLGEIAERGELHVALGYMSDVGFV